MVIIVMVVLAVGVGVWVIRSGRFDGPQVDSQSFCLERVFILVGGAVLAGAIALLIAWLRYG